MDTMLSFGVSMISEVPSNPQLILETDFICNKRSYLDLLHVVILFRKTLKFSFLKEN